MLVPFVEAEQQLLEICMSGQFYGNIYAKRHQHFKYVILIHLLNFKHLREDSQAHIMLCFIHKNRIVDI